MAHLRCRSPPRSAAPARLRHLIEGFAPSPHGQPAHVPNAAAHVDPAGHWKVRKIKQSHKIGALVASVIAYSRAARAPAKREPLFAWA